MRPLYGSQNDKGEWFDGKADPDIAARHAMRDELTETT